jgi:formylglycine-generating enzyme required for sulfatase activity
VSESAIRELHELSAAHANGTLAPAAYRARRAQIIDGLVGLAPEVAAPEVTRPRAPASTSPVKVTGPVPVSPPRPAVTIPPIAKVPDLPEPRPSRGPWPAIAIVAVVALAAGAWWFLGRPASKSEVAATQVPEPEPSSAGPEQVSPDQMVTDFLSRDTWTDAAISAFNTAWWALSDAQVAPLLEQPSVQRLRDAVSAKLADKAVQAQSGAAKLDPSAPLVLLARNLNVAVPDAALSGYPGAAATKPPVKGPAPAPASAPPPSPKPVVADMAAKTSTPTVQAPVSHEVRNPPPPTAAAQPAATAAPGVSSEPASSAGSSAATVAQTLANDSCRVYFTNPRHRLCQDTQAGGAEAPRLAIIPAGSFTMGSSANADEQPAHTVNIARPFAVTINEVSFADYERYCRQAGKSCPTQPWTGESRPVVQVSWQDANDYAKWLSQATGQRYRLPTEAEWEYMARAGSKGDFWADAPLDASQARFNTDSSAPPTTPAEDTMEVSANSWKVKHVAGNVREWVADTWFENYNGAPADGSARVGSGPLRVVRGGSYRDPLPKLRSAAREKLDSNTKDALTGIRLVREIAP